MSPITISNFKTLFRLVKENYKHPANTYGFRTQSQTAWDGIVAGQITAHIQFLEADGISAVLDTKTNKLRFNEGSAVMLEFLLAQQTAKLALNIGTLATR